MRLVNGLADVLLLSGRARSGHQGGGSSENRGRLGASNWSVSKCLWIFGGLFGGIWWFITSLQLCEVNLFVISYFLKTTLKHNAVLGLDLFFGMVPCPCKEQHPPSKVGFWRTTNWFNRWSLCRCLVDFDSTSSFSGDPTLDHASFTAKAAQAACFVPLIECTIVQRNRMHNCAR